jgi:hypothetical protein
VRVIIDETRYHGVIIRRLFDNRCQKALQLSYIFDFTIIITRQPPRRACEHFYQRIVAFTCNIGKPKDLNHQKAS